MKKYILIAFVVLLNITSVLSQDEREVIQLSGVIRNDSTKTLPFVSIAVMGTRRGAISDFWGYYSIPVYPNDTIRFSSIGYSSLEYVLPAKLDGTNYSKEIVLYPDTVFLKEIVIFPWRTYDQFLSAVVELELPDDDMARARKNIAMVQQQLISAEYQADASLNFKYIMNEKYKQAYTAGQYPSVSLLNPFAWAQFFEALKSGMFKSKTKIY